MLLPPMYGNLQSAVAAAFSRQELVEVVNRGAEVWRKRWTEFVRQRYYDFTYGLTKAILAVSPDSEMAYQYPVVNAYGGRDVNYLFEAMRDAADGRPPKSRPGSGFYGDDDPNGMLPKSLIIRYGNAVTAPFVVDRWPEIENLPYSPLGKTFLGTCTESSLYLAAGCNRADLCGLNEPYGRERLSRGIVKQVSSLPPLLGGVDRAKRPHIPLRLSSRPKPGTPSAPPKKGGTGLFICPIPLVFRSGFGKNGDAPGV